MAERDVISTWMVTSDVAGRVATMTMAVQVAFRETMTMTMGNRTVAPV